MPKQKFVLDGRSPRKADLPTAKLRSVITQINDTTLE